jgi:hypothetical protein
MLWQIWQVLALRSGQLRNRRSGFESRQGIIFYKGKHSGTVVFIDLMCIVCVIYNIFIIIIIYNNEK